MARCPLGVSLPPISTCWAARAAMGETAQDVQQRQMQGWSTCCKCRCKRRMQVPCPAPPPVTHPVGFLQVLDGGALRQELGVGQDLKLHRGVGAVAAQHLQRARAGQRPSPRNSSCVQRLHRRVQPCSFCNTPARSISDPPVPFLCTAHNLPASACRTFSMASAVLTGTVDFSTMILLLLDTDAITRAAPSQ